MLKCEARLQQLFSQLSDEENEEASKRRLTQLTQELGLFCNFCGQRYGFKDESLQALTCSHLFHEKYGVLFFYLCTSRFFRCLKVYLGARQRKNCPKCHYMQQRQMTRDSCGSPSQAVGTPTHLGNATGEGSGNYNNPGSAVSRRIFTTTNTTVDV